MTPAEIIDAFVQLRTGSRDGARLPHKPLLALLALGRWANGDRGPIPFADVEGKLRDLIRAYGPPGAGNPQEPFWRLRRDGLWDLGGTAHLAAPAAPAPPGLRELRAGVTGRFSETVQKALEAEPELVGRIARLLLETNFPESLHADIAADVGLDLSEPSPDPAPPAGADKRRSRDPGFRSRVLRAYGNRCALCRVKLHVGCEPTAHR
jgi:putative restriction endonuclease